METQVYGQGRLGKPIDHRNNKINLPGRGGSPCIINNDITKRNVHRERGRG